MTGDYPLVIEIEECDTDDLLREWRWLVPGTQTPLLLTVFGDWIFGSPDGSIWFLDTLEGACTYIASSSAEFNRLKKEQENLNIWFMAEWVMIAGSQGLIPDKGQCLGWKIAPVIGGEFSLNNLQLFDLRVYESIQGQLHRQLNGVQK